ncbi:type I 3-dehydroquinate dehydratase [Terrisporobacter petrolearius]|uniref:type I 3-dehydroquinate dehydratase n=1 Tax=Terrisporobacter petrolearius TaxID=1460447 RepID=UPI001D161C2F|nr:type I 3-dehydroquinate dehydratase [Terrisporobacter petrolearius]MCC3865759.1 type I 3-dehydroquinate dehydratase [Terrisporobacter petrolearius]
MNTVKIKNVVLGEGKPKICVPIVGITKEDILNQARALENVEVDVVEWRIDWFEGVFQLEKVKDVLVDLRKELKELPLLFTFRTSKEGGEKSIENKEYASLNKAVAATGLVDLVDVEVFTGDDYVKEIIKSAHESDVKVIASNHDFDKTPSKGDIVSRLIKMQDLGADIPKIAVMPKCKLDVLELLEATVIMSEQYATRPIITMSMAGQGAISRLCGEVFGSCLTFGAVSKASAPGQINVEELNKVLNIINKSL